MKILATEKEITFTFPRYGTRHNPYDEEEHGEYPYFTGLIVRHKGYTELGFAGTIDMSYKDKGDQVSDFIVMWNGSEEDFIKKCEELDFDIHTIYA